MNVGSDGSFAANMLYEIVVLTAWEVSVDFAHGSGSGEAVKYFGICVGRVVCSFFLLMDLYSLISGAALKLSAYGSFLIYFLGS